MSKFWHFNQNNSGGSFSFNKKAGITHHVIIEAKTADEASARAQDIGIYYDGVREGMDCGCCGDRWSEPYGDGDDAPLVYGKPFAEWDAPIVIDDKQFPTSRWMEEGHEVCVHYLDGRKEWA